MAECGRALPNQYQSIGLGPLVLNKLQLSAGTLLPPFDPLQTHYAADWIPQSQITVTATANNPAATLRINGQSSDSTIELGVPGSESTLTIDLTANNQTTARYTVTLNPQPLGMTVSMPTALPLCTADLADTDGDNLMDNNGVAAHRSSLAVAVRMVAAHAAATN